LYFINILQSFQSNFLGVTIFCYLKAKGGNTFIHSLLFDKLEFMNINVSLLVLARCSPHQKLTVSIANTKGVTK
ncbi:hypothetical protein, partial [uncultured Wocania sp.]|uniref:hypothetical protein n=1 Tax=uncultured Wocania sp. TaxID=2834404 RepID=UPI0030FA01EC